MLVSGLRGSRGLGFRPSGSELKRLYLKKNEGRLYLWLRVQGFGFVFYTPPPTPQQRGFCAFPTWRVGVLSK